MKQQAVLRKLGRLGDQGSSDLDCLTALLQLPILPSALRAHSTARTDVPRGVEYSSRVTLAEQRIIQRIVCVYTLSLAWQLTVVLCFLSV